MSDLTSHLKLKHRNEKDVAYALTQDQITRNRIFLRIRNLGMEKQIDLNVPKKIQTSKEKDLALAVRGRQLCAQTAKLFCCQKIWPDITG